MRVWIAGSLTGLILSGIASLAAGEVPPFFGGGTIASDSSGDVIMRPLDSPRRNMLSPDMKYVTFETQPSPSDELRSMVAASPVQYSPTGQGFVGGVNLPSGTSTQNSSGSAGATSAVAGSSAVVPGNATSPDQLDRAAKSWVFARVGMYLVKRLD